MNHIGQHKKGFTLIELMVTVAIAAILVTAGVPSFQSFVRNNRKAAQVNRLVGALQLARSEAITRKVNVTLRPGSANDDDTVTASNDWSDGWVVFTDKKNDGTFNNANDTLLNALPALDGGNTLKARPAALISLSYGADGRSSQAGALVLCDRSGDYLQGVVVSATGTVRTSDTDAAGNQLNCN
jgi:type IV fimbrial biogenesis protein FimT